MGRKRNRADRISATRQFAIDFFVNIWRHLSSFTHAKARFALHWMWRNDAVLKIYARDVMGMKEGYNKCLLMNGYRDCLKFNPSTFSPAEWASIESVFADHLSMKHLPEPVQVQIRALGRKRGIALCRHLRKQIETAETELRLSTGKVMVKKIKESTKKQCSGHFLGDWEKQGIDLVLPKFLHKIMDYPRDFTVIRVENNFTNIYDVSGVKPVLVGMLLKQSILTEEEKAFIRLLMSQLFAAHNQIEHDRCEVLTGRMVGFGPFYHSRQKEGGNKISFYTPVQAVKEIFRKLSLGDQFSELVDRHAHGTLMDIILGLFLQWCPTLLQSFFDYSDPYLAMDSYEASEFEKELGGKGPCAYQLYVTEDYCVEYHVDDDKSDFTLCYASHPDAASTSPIDFVLAAYGIRLPVGDGDLFAFRSDQGHATAYRRPSTNPAYIGAVTVNMSLSHLMRRRQQV